MPEPEIDEMTLRYMKKEGWRYSKEDDLWQHPCGALLAGIEVRLARLPMMHLQSVVARYRRAHERGGSGPGQAK